MIPLKCGELKASIPAFRHLTSMKLPAPAAYAVAKMMNRIDDELKEYNNVLQALISDNNGIVLEDGTIEFEFDGGEEKFNAELDDLNESTVSLVVDPVSIEKLGSVELPPSVLMATHWLFVD